MDIFRGDITDISAKKNLTGREHTSYGGYQDTSGSF